jgi:hypothetical protein
MIRRLGALVLVACGSLLAGCSVLGGASPCNLPEAQQHEAILNALPRMANHDCSHYWGPEGTDLLSRLNLQPKGWAVNLTGPDGAAVRDALNLALSSLNRSLPAAPPSPPGPGLPAAAPTAAQLDIAFLALQLEDLVEADHWSGAHPPHDVQGWLTMGTTYPASVTLATNLRTAIKDALDM